jgi:hypothetical protein
MLFYTLLFFSGYRFNSEKKLTFQNINKTKIILIKYTLFFLYSLFILGLFLFRVIYISQQLKNTIDYIILIYFIIVPVQYILGLIYFNSEHFYKILTKIDNFNDNKYTFLIILYTVLMVINNNSYTITNVIINTITNIYSWLSIFININSFFIVFYYHTREIKKFSKEIETKDWNNLMNNNNINIIIIKLSNIRESYNISVNKLNNLFSYTCILGGIATYIFLKLLIKGTILNRCIYINIILYIIVQCIFINIIYLINNSISNIKNIIFSSNFVKKYLGRKDHFEELELIIEDSNTKNLINKENASSLDWIILSIQLDKEWNQFKIMGFKVENALFQRFSTLIGLYLSINYYSLYN